MLREKVSYRKYMKTQRKAEKQGKNRTELCNLRKANKS